MMRAPRLAFLLLVASTLIVAGCAAPSEADDQDDVIATSPAAVDTDTVKPKACPPFCFPFPTHEVRIAPTVINNTARPTSEVAPIMLDAIRTKLNADPDIDVDEGSDPTTSSDARYVRGQLKSITFTSSTGNLNVKCALLVFSYPNLGLMGEVSKSITAIGLPSPDIASQNQLISLCMSSATQTFINSL